MSQREIFEIKKDEEKLKNEDKEKERDRERDKERYENDEKFKTLFKKVKTFEQLKRKVYEIKTDCEINSKDISNYKEKYDSISKQLEKLNKSGGTFEQAEDEKNYKNYLNAKISDIDKKFNIILGDINKTDKKREEEEEEKEKDKESKDKDKYTDKESKDKESKDKKSKDKDSKDEESKDKENKNVKSIQSNKIEQIKKAKLFNLSDINKRLTQLQFSKLNTLDFNTANELFLKKIDEIEVRINELSSNLYVEKKEKINELKIGNNMNFVLKTEFEKHINKTEEDFKRVWDELKSLRKSVDEMYDKIKENANLKDLESMKDLILLKVEELFLNQKKKYSSSFSTIQLLQEQFKKLLEMLAIKEEKDKDNWLIAKKPIKGYTCASCEGFIGDLKTDKNRFIHWNKMPSRERDFSGEKFYRIGNGYSRLLQMLNIDNNGNMTLNPFANMNENSNSSIFSSNENNKSQDLNKSLSRERVYSAKSKKGIREQNKTMDALKSRNNESKNVKNFPVIKFSMSSENFDKSTDRNINKHTHIGGNNTSFNFKNSKIIKISKKNQSKYDL